jgi:hypothetical protein
MHPAQHPRAYLLSRPPRPSSSPPLSSVPPPYELRSGRYRVLGMAGFREEAVRALVFHLFPYLPSELQRMIWTVAMSDSLDVAVTAVLGVEETCAGTETTLHIPRFPAVFHATHTSRKRAKNLSKSWDCLHNVPVRGHEHAWLHYHAPSQVLEIHIAGRVDVITTSDEYSPALEVAFLDWLSAGYLDERHISCTCLITASCTGDYSLQLRTISLRSNLSGDCPSLRHRSLL